MASSARREIFAGYSPDQRRRWFACAPVVERVLFDERERRASLYDEQPFQRFIRPADMALPTSSDEVVAALERTDGLEALVQSLDHLSLELAREAAWQGGTLTDRPAGADDPIADSLDEAAEHLRFMMVARPRAKGGPWLSLFGDSMRCIPVPGLSVDYAADHIGFDAIGAILKRLSTDKLEPNKPARIAQWKALLNEPSTYDRVLPALSPAARALFDELVAAVGPAPMDRFGLPYYRRWGITDAKHRPLIELCEHGFAAVDEDRQSCWVWREVVGARRPVLHTAWPQRPPLEPRPVALEAPRLPTVVTTFERVLTAWKQRPPDALADGGVGVSTVRRLAKDFDISAGTAGLFVHLAIAMKVLDRSLGKVTGRGRNQRAPWLWSVDTSAWSALDQPQRWLAMVDCWLNEVAYDDAAGLPERHAGYASWFDKQSALVARRVALRFFEELDPQVAVPLDRAVLRLQFDHPSVIGVSAAESIIEAMQCLGILSDESGSSVRLTAAARALLRLDLAALAPAGGSRGFIVQGDHSVIAPPDLEPEVYRLLEQIATTESQAGAHIFRLSDASLAYALDAGHSADEIEAFLRTHSDTEPPQNVVHLIHDVARRHGKLMISSGSTVVYCDDPIRLAAAVAVKAAKLTLVGPTVAVSSLPEGKVFDVLRAKGLMPAATGRDEPAEHADPVAAAKAEIVANRFRYVGIAERDKRALVFS